MGLLGQDFPSGLRRHRRRGGDLSAERLHDRTAVGLLLVADLDHVDGQFQTERLGCVGEGRAPLSGSRFGRDVGDAFLFAVIGLCQRRVELVGTHGADAFVLEVDVGRRAERFFQIVGPHERRAAVVFVLFAHGFGNVDPCVGLVHFLIGQRAGEDRVEILGPERLAGGGVERRHGFVGHVGRDVVPAGGDFGFGQNEAFGFRAHGDFVFCSSYSFVYGKRAVVSSTALLHSVFRRIFSCTADRLTTWRVESAATSMYWPERRSSFRFVFANVTKKAAKMQGIGEIFLILTVL